MKAHALADVHALAEAGACACCNGTRAVLDVCGELRPCSICCPDAFTAWADSRRPRSKEPGPSTTERTYAALIVLTVAFAMLDWLLFLGWLAGHAAGGR